MSICELMFKGNYLSYALEREFVIAIMLSELFDLRRIDSVFRCDNTSRRYFQKTKAYN